MVRERNVAGDPAARRAKSGLMSKLRRRISRAEVGQRLRDKKRPLPRVKRHVHPVEAYRAELVAPANVLRAMSCRCLASVTLLDVLSPLELPLARVHRRVDGLRSKMSSRPPLHEPDVQRAAPPVRRACRRMPGARRCASSMGSLRARGALCEMRRASHNTAHFMMIAETVGCRRDRADSHRKAYLPKHAPNHPCLWRMRVMDLLLPLWSRRVPPLFCRSPPGTGAISEAMACMATNSQGT